MNVFTYTAHTRQTLNIDIHLFIKV